MSSEQPAPTRTELWRWCLRADAVAPCFVRDVAALREDTSREQDTFWWLGTVPCRSVAVVGILVGARAFERCTVYTLDDGTGAIQCVQFTKPAAKHHTPPPAPAHAPPYAVGDILRVAGRVEKWHDGMQLLVADIAPCAPNAEPEHWLAVAALHATHYTRPFAIPPLPPAPPPAPKTPVKPASRTSTAPTPSTAASASPTAGPARLRHPARLRSAELIASTFKIYLKNYMDVLSDPSRADADADSPTTPTPRHRADTPPPPPRPKGFTLSHLRRVPELAALALRVVHAEAKRRARAAHAETKRRAPPAAPPEPARKKAKRLFTWALRALLREGSIVLHADGAPAWDTAAAAVWGARRAPEPDPEDGALSEPPAREEAYLPLTPAALAEPVADAIRRMMLRRPTGGRTQARGPTAEELRAYLGAVDARWEHVTEYAVADALQLLKAQDRVYKIGMGRWELSL